MEGTSIHIPEYLARHMLDSPNSVDVAMKMKREESIVRLSKILQFEFNELNELCKYLTIKQINIIIELLLTGKYDLEQAIEQVKPFASYMYRTKVDI